MVAAQSDVSGDGGVLKVLLQEGAGQLPQYAAGAKVMLRFEARTKEGKELDSTSSLDNGDFELRLGKEFVVPGWEMAVKTMKVGERARFLMKAKHCAGYSQLASVLRREAKNAKDRAAGREVAAHSGGGCCGHAMASQMEGNSDLMEIMGSDLQFEFEILSVEESGSFEKEHWEMSLEEKSTMAPQLRQEGNMLYKQGRYEEAAEKYGVALGYVEQLTLDRLEKQQDEDLKAMEVACKLNYAACKLKMKDYMEVILRCTEVLQKSPENVKAFYRRGQAHLEKGRELELAVEDFKRVLSLDAKNSEAGRGLREANRLIKESGKKQKEVMRTMVTGEKNVGTGHSMEAHEVEEVIPTGFS